MCGLRRVGGQRRKRSECDGVKKLVWRWPKIKELLRNGCREEIGLQVIDESYCETDS